MYKILSKYEQSTRSLQTGSLCFSCLECCKRARMRYHSCAPWREHWLQTIRFVDVNASFTLMLLFT